MLYGLRAGATLGEAELPVVGHRDEHHVVGGGRRGQDLLQTGALVRPQAAADAELVLAAAAGHVLTLSAHVSLSQTGVDVAASVTKQLFTWANVSFVIRNHRPALHRISTREQSCVCEVVDVYFLFKVPIERLIQFSQM